MLQLLCGTRLICIKGGGSLKTNPKTLENLHYGRQRIILDYDEVTPDNLFEVMQKALGIHKQNALDCEYLIDYFLGDQDILGRMGGGTSNINNTTVVNFAYPITREIVGYTYGNPTEFIPKKIEYQKDVTTIADIFNYEDSHTVDICSGIYASICGLGYMITLPSDDISKDMTPDIPIVHTYLDPRTTFIVQSPKPGNPTLMSCMFRKNKITGKTDYTVFTNKYKFEFTNMDKKTLKESVNPIGKQPITMVENAIFLTGDWEQAIAVMNAQNQVTSDALNDIEGTIKSVLVIIGAEFDNQDTKLQQIKENRVLTLAKGNGENSGLDAKFIAPQLDSTSVENIRDYLEKARNIITGIPDRSANANGGDTGVAVLNRDGWTDIEIVARLKEIFYKKAKKQQLDVAIAILKKLDLITDDISPLYIDISVGRHTTDNLQTKTQAFATLVSTGELATIDALELSSLTNKSREIVERGEEAKKQRQEEAIRVAKESAAASGEGSSQNGANKTAEIEKAAANNGNGATAESTKSNK